MLPPRPRGHQRFSIFHGRADDEAGRRAWHQAYADVFRGCASVLDVGCGTGVFLDLLRERGVERRLGIDRDPEMIEESRARGHEAQAGDVRVALRALGERFDGIHVSFVIETMDGEEGLALLADCVGALRPSGTLVVRTLNPRNAVVRDGAFWYEPWAKRPWPLETLHVAFGDLGLRIVGAGNEPDGWQHLYLVGRAAAAAVEEPPVVVAWQGEFFAYNSMAVVNRELARALRAHADVAPVLVPDEPRAEPSVAADPRYAWLREHARRSLPPARVLIRQSNGAADFRRDASVAKIVQILPWEYGALPRAWVEGVRDGADEIWVPSTYCARMFLDAGVAPERVAVVPNGIDPAHFSVEREVAPYPIPSRKGFRFLYLGGVLPRKGVDALLAAYRGAFRRDDDVTLVLKIFGTRSFYPLPDGGASFAAFAADPQAPELIVLDEDVSDEEVMRLYRSCDALAFPYRGEGFGLPMLEAMACGLPVIATAGGAADDFLDGEVAYRIAAERRALRGAFRGETLAGEGWWLEPNIEDLAATLRHVVAHRDEARGKGLAGAARARRDWTWEHAAAIAAGRLRALVAG